MALESARIREIVATLRGQEEAFLERHPAFTHRDAIAMTFWIFGIAGAVGSAALYLTGLLPAWATVILIALFVSVLHELEHDLIHSLYFPKRPWVQHMMFAGIWLFKQSLNPWARKSLHIQHHRKSGQVTDVEERLLGIGIRPLWARVLIAFNPTSVVFLNARIRKDVPHFFPPGRAHRRWRLAARTVDYVWLVWLPVWIGLFIAGVPAATPVMVLSILPHMLRHGSIALMSSYSHYYGDLEDGDVLKQNQILRHPLVWPFQMFCWNFGATHVLHHFYVAQPFYLRTLLSGPGLEYLAAQGTPVNDFGIVARANRRAETQEAHQPEPA